MQLKKLFGVALLVICLGFLLPLISEDLINQVNAAEKNKVLLFIRHAATSEYGEGGTPSINELMITEEVNVMTSMLEGAGFDVVIASASGEPFEGESTQLLPDITLADVNVKEYAGIMLPCFALGSQGAGWEWQASPEEISLVQDAVASGKPIAAQHGAIRMLLDAGALVGKKYTYTSDFTIYGDGPKLAGAIYRGIGVVQDGSVITSSHCPYYGHDHGTSELTELFIAALQKQ